MKITKGKISLEKVIISNGGRSKLTKLVGRLKDKSSKITYIHNK